MITHVYQHVQINIQTCQAKNIKGEGGQNIEGQIQFGVHVSNTISIEKPITGDNIQRNKIREKRFDSLPGGKFRRRLHQVVFLGILTVRVAVHPWLLPPPLPCLPHLSRGCNNWGRIAREDSHAESSISCVCASNIFMEKNFFYTSRLVRLCLFDETRYSHWT